MKPQSFSSLFPFTRGSSLHLHCVTPPPLLCSLAKSATTSATTLPPRLGILLHRVPNYTTSASTAAQPSVYAIERQRATRGSGSSARFSVSGQRLAFLGGEDEAGSGGVVVLGGLFEALSCRVGKLDCRGVRSLEVALGVVASHGAADSFSCCSCVAVCGEESGEDPSSKSGSNEVIVGFVDNLRELGFDVLFGFLGRCSSLVVGEALGKELFEACSFQQSISRCLSSYSRNLTEAGGAGCALGYHFWAAMGVVLEILAALGIIKANHFWLEVEHLEEAIQNVLICLKMVVFSVLQQYVYHVAPYSGDVAQKMRLKKHE
ncbi:hypothetical protein Drorol1_Dr00021183 [Drosera rotundifolia]